MYSVAIVAQWSCASHTVGTGNLAPDDPDVGAPDLTLGPVDESNLLAQVEAVKKSRLSCVF